MRYILLILLSSVSVFAQPPAGQWRGIIEYENNLVPFEFEITHDPDQLIIMNGDEQVPLDAIFNNDSLVVRLAPFDAQLQATYSDMIMSGYWSKGYRDSGIVFRAYYKQSRFDRKHDASIDISGTYMAQLQTGPFRRDEAVLTLDSRDNQVHGTIQTDVGDYRYLSGVVNQDSLWISAFDGVHALLLKAAVVNDSLTGAFISDSNYAQNINAVKSSEAALSDPFVEVNSRSRPYYDILVAADSSQYIDLSLYFDKVLVIQLFGTWCPNSWDQARYLAKWYDQREDDVEMLAVTYEPNFSIEYASQRIADYKRDMQANYPIYIGGRLNKADPALAFPGLDRIQAFPTLVILDKQGVVRYMANYMNGPATGRAHQQYWQRFEQIINQLRSE